MRLLSWNLGGLDDEALDERTEAAVFTAVLGARLDELHAGTKPKPPPDVLLLQEVVAHTLTAHLQPHFAAAGYTIIGTEHPNRASFEAIAFRAPLALTAYEQVALRDSVFGRVLHVADFDSPQGRLRVLTAHCDSGIEAGNLRKAQLHQIAECITPRGVFAGDANLRKAEWLDVRHKVGLIDAWEALGEPGATRVTWRRGDHKARFDRVFLGSNVVARSLEAVGSNNLPGLGVAISDHVGLLADVQPTRDQ